MFAACQNHINNLSCLILIHLDDQMQFHNQIRLVSMEFWCGIQSRDRVALLLKRRASVGLNSLSCDGMCSGVKVWMQWALDFPFDFNLVLSSVWWWAVRSRWGSGLNNAHKASSAQTLNGFMTEVLSDIQLCWTSEAQGMGGSACLPHYSQPRQAVCSFFSGNASQTNDWFSILLGRQSNNAPGAQWHGISLERACVVVFKY